MTATGRPDPCPLVSVVVVTLNGGAPLRNCLAGLAAQTYPRVEMLVVDNGSSAPVAETVQALLPSARCIRLERNAGFAGGNNAGIRAANGRYVALINDDAVAAPEWLDRLVATAEADGRLAAVASLVIDGNRSSVLDSCGVGIALDGMSRQAGRGRPVPALSAPVDVLAFSGCACLLRADALRETGLFDERFFAYCEDTDLSLRLRRAGGRIAAAPGAYVTHYYSQTGGAFSARKVFWVERNHFWVAVKNFPLTILALVPAVTGWRYLVQFYAALRRRPSALDGFFEQTGPAAIVRAVLRAHLSAWAGLPAMLRRRRRARRGARLGDAAMRRLLCRFRLPVYEVVAGWKGDRESL